VTPAPVPVSLPELPAGPASGGPFSGLCIITVPGVPTGKGRPKFVKATGRAYTPKSTASRENAVGSAAASAWRAPPSDAPFDVTVTLVLPVPPSWSKKKQAAALAGDVPPTAKPDLDNAVKLVADALNEIVWRDDKQITRLTAVKRYGITPQTIIEVRHA
jgi:Holliday junction resolvase RusA-like endonuclease